MSTLRVAALALPPRLFEDGTAMGRTLVAQLYPLSELGVQLAVFPGFYGFGLWGPGAGADRASVGETLRAEYQAAGSRAARAAGVYLVPGSLPVPVGAGRYVHYAALFDPQGDLVGGAFQTHRGADDDDLEVGEELPVLPTPWGGLGILLGADPWYPEVARILCRRGANLLVAPLAPPAPYPPEEAMAGLWAAVQGNGVFGIESGLRGNVGQREAAGRAAVLAPTGQSPDGSGFQSGPGYLGAEGYLLAELDFSALAKAQEERLASPAARLLYGRTLPELYQEYGS